MTAVPLLRRDDDAEHIEPWAFGMVVARFGDVIVGVGVESLPDVDEAVRVAGRYAAKAAPGAAKAV